MHDRDSSAELERAMAQLSDIHAQISQTGYFRGYRAATTGAIGLLAFLAAAIQDRLGLTTSLELYLVFWLGIATLCLGIVLWDLFWRSRHRSQPGLRAQTRSALEQFLPAVAAGALVTLLFFQDERAILLPGLWAILEGLGIAASRPFLPRRIQSCSLFFLLTGAAMLASAENGVVPSPWSMGACFGAGHLLAAVVLYVDVERQPQRGVTWDD